MNQLCSSANAEIVASALKKMKMRRGLHRSVGVVNFTCPSKKRLTDPFGDAKLWGWVSRVFQVKVACQRMFDLMVTDSEEKRGQILRRCKELGQFWPIIVVRGSEMFDYLEKAILYLFRHAIRYEHRKMRRHRHVRLGRTTDNFVRAERFQFAH